MTEQITLYRIEDAIEKANDFLQYERSSELDGDFASQQLESRVISVEEAAKDILTRNPIQGSDGMFLPLSKFNVHDYDVVANTLPGYFVLVPPHLVNEKGALFPAVVSEQQGADGSIRLHVLKQPYKQELTFTARTMLSGSGQFETEGIGEHDSGRVDNDGVEAEHFATLLAVGSDPFVQQRWLAGDHINHDWRESDATSVTTEVGVRLFGNEIPQETITVTRQQIATGHAFLLWHERMTNEETKAPETATKQGAVVIVQALGFQALKELNPSGVEEIKKVIG